MKIMFRIILFLGILNAFVVWNPTIHALESTKQITIKVGKEFEIRLKENWFLENPPEHVWSLSFFPSGIEIVDNYYQPPNLSNGVGSPGTRIFRLKAVAPSQSQLIFKKSRPGYRDVYDERKINLNVEPSFLSRLISSMDCFDNECNAVYFSY